MHYNNFTKTLISTIKTNKSFIRFFNVSIITSFLALLLGKLIATYFEPHSFGEYTLITSAISLFIGFIATPAVQSFRYGFNQREYNDLISFYRSFLFWMTLVISSIVILIATFFKISSLIVFVGCLLLFMQSGNSLLTAGINIMGMHKTYGNIQLITQLCTLASLSIFIFVLKINSSLFLLISILLSEICIFIASTLLIHEHKRFILKSPVAIFNDDWFKSFYQYIKPLFVLPVFVWIVNSGDKYLIRLYLGDSQVGLYSAAYSIGSKFFLIGSGVVISFLNASTFAISADSKNYKKIKKKTINRLSIYYCIGLFFLIILYLFSNQIGNLLLSKSYSNSFVLIPILGSSSLILTSFYFLEQVVYAVGKTKIITTHYIIGAIINTILNIISIPKYGLIGCAVSMVISSTIQFFILLFLFKKMLKSNES